MKAHEYYNDSDFIFYTIGTSQYSQALISSLTREWHDTVHAGRHVCLCVRVSVHFYLNKNHFEL